jgi:quercetin dioxygenase-like cupin family protein
MARPTEAQLEANIIRYEGIEDRTSPFRPRDMLLPRYERERYAVIGRFAEEPTTGTSLGGATAYSMVYPRREPGEGIGSHAHASTEVFVAMAGRWEIDVEGAKTVPNPFDVVSVPPDLFHAARDVGVQPAVPMALSEGQTGVPIRLDPAPLSEIRAAGHVVSDPEYPPGPRANQGAPA